MPALIPWPFPLPERFLDALGYPRVVEAFDSPAMRARLTELLRRQGTAEPQPMPTGPRRFVALYWEPAGDELAFTDGRPQRRGPVAALDVARPPARPQPRGAAAGARSPRRPAGRARSRPGLNGRP